jgi:muramoyltetrapeptide carboxypeptidase LdcA involved in peptidoglycan recycling
MTESWHIAKATLATMKPTIQRRLRQGDAIRIIAPSRSLAIIGDRDRDVLVPRFEQLGLRFDLRRPR